MENKGWVKITEELPPLYDTILAIVHPKDCPECPYLVMTWCKYATRLNGEKYLWFATDDFDDGDDESCVSHWMAIPGYPDEGEWE